MLGFWSVVSSETGMPSAAFVAALARSLAAHGRRVLLLDLSPAFPALDVALGVSERVVYTLADVGRVPADAVLLSLAEAEKGSISFVPLAVGDTVDGACVTACVEAAGADIVLAYADRDTLTLARTLSDGLLLLTRADEAYLRAAVALTRDAAFDGFVLTDFLPLREEIECEPALTDLADTLALPLFGILPRTELKNTVRPRGKDFLTAVDNMAGRLTGAAVPLLCGIPIEGMRRRTFFARTTGMKR